MTAFKVGDKVLHPLTGDNVMGVPYTPPRASTYDLMAMVYATYGRGWEGNLAKAKALAEAATAYAERLQEEAGE